MPLKDVTWYNFSHLFLKKITDKVRQKIKLCYNVFVKIIQKNNFEALE